MANRLKEKYTNEVVPALTDKFNYSSVMAVPKVDKIVLNMGVGDAVNNSKNLEKAAAELALISGQKPSVRKMQKRLRCLWRKQKNDICISRQSELR